MLPAPAATTLDAGDYLNLGHAAVHSCAANTGVCTGAKLRHTPAPDGRRPSAEAYDNVGRIGDWPEEVRPYRNFDDLLFFRDCDPSILPAHCGTKTLRTEPAWWLPEQKTLPALAPGKMQSWIESEEDEPNTPDLFDIRDRDGRAWLLLYGNHSLADDGGGHRYISYRVNTLMVRKSQRDGVLRALEARHSYTPKAQDSYAQLPDHHIPRAITNGGYFGRFLWGGIPSITASNMGLNSFEPREKLLVIEPIIGYRWRDSSGWSFPNVTICLPSGWLNEQLGLSAKPGSPGTFVDADGATVFIDPSDFTESVAVIDRQRFLAFLDRSEWDCLWVIGAIKRGPPHDGVITSRHHVSATWWENGSWQRRAWHFLERLSH